MPLLPHLPLSSQHLLQLYLVSSFLAPSLTYVIVRRFVHVSLFELCNIPEELFSIHLVQLAHNILDRILQSWDNHMLDRINTSISCADNFVQDRKCRL